MPLTPISWGLALLLSVAPPEHIEEELSPRARELLETGTAAYERGDFAAAIAAFEEGYAVQPAPVFLYTWAQAARYMDDCATAIDLYDRFLATNPPDEQREAAEQYRAKCAPAEPPQPAPVPPPRVVPENGIAPPGPLETRSPRVTTRDRIDPVGASLLAVGVALVGAGAGLTAAGAVAVRREEDAEVYEEFRDQHRRKLAFLGSGIPVVSIGVALVAGAIARLVVHRRGRR